MQLNTYLNFNGDCADAFKFYQRCLGGEIVAMLPFGDTPGCEDMGPESRDKIMHACLLVNGQMLMGTDATPGHPYEGVKGAHVSINVDTPEEAERVFKDMTKDATVIMPLEPTFWAQRFGIFQDQFGVSWMVNCASPDYLAQAK